jgi:hypothetical protein
LEIVAGGETGHLFAGRVGADGGLSAGGARVVPALLCCQIVPVAAGIRA